MERRIRSDPKRKRLHPASRFTPHASRLWPAKVFFWTSLTLSMVISGVAIWGGGGWLDLQELRRELTRLESRSKVQKRENQQLQAEIKALHDLDHVEKIAREELGLIKPGEILYEFAGKPQSKLTWDGQREN